MIAFGAIMTALLLVTDFNSSNSDPNETSSEVSAPRPSAPSTTSLPLRRFNALLVARNSTFRLTNNKIHPNLARAMASSLAEQLNTTVDRIRGLRISDGGVQAIMAKRSLTARAGTDSTVSFEVDSHDFRTSGEVREKLLRCNPLRLANYEIVKPDVYVWRDNDPCPNAPCSDGYVCAYSYFGLKIVPVDLRPSCVPAGDHSPHDGLSGFNPLYLLLLIVPVSIAVAVLLYCCCCRRRRCRHHHHHQRSKQPPPGHMSHRFIHLETRRPEPNNNHYDGAANERSGMALQGREDDGSSYQAVS